jgi:hypothetical protein
VIAQPPIIVKIVEPEETGLAEVLIGALGLSGLLLLAALVAGVAMAGLLYWFRSREP